MLCPTRFVVETTEQERRRDERSLQLPDWIMNKIKREHIIFGVVIVFSHYHIATMQPVVIRHAPTTLEWKIISGGKQIPVETEDNAQQLKHIVHLWKK